MIISEHGLVMFDEYYSTSNVSSVSLDICEAPQNRTTAVSMVQGTIAPLTDNVTCKVEFQDPSGNDFTDISFRAMNSGTTSVQSSNSTSSGAAMHYWYHGNNSSTSSQSGERLNFIMWVNVQRHGTPYKDISAWGLCSNDSTGGNHHTGIFSMRSNVSTDIGKLKFTATSGNIRAYTTSWLLLAED